MPRALDLLSDDRRDELTAQAHDAFRDGGHLEVHRTLTAEFFGDDWAEEHELLDGTERWDRADQAFYRCLISSRLFTLSEKERMIEAYPMSETMIQNVEIVLRGERRALKLILGEIISDVDQNTIGTLTGGAS